MKKIVEIDGNIGAGKTTIIKLLKEKCIEKYKVVVINEWNETEEGKKMLKLRYYEPKKYVFEFNKNMLEYLLKEIKKLKDLDFDIAFIDRSAWSHLFVFSELHRTNGNISEEEYKFLKNIYLECYSELEKKGFYSFYLHRPVETCIKNIEERLKKENREGEESIKEDFLKKIEEMGLLKQAVILESDQEKILSMFFELIDIELTCFNDWEWIRIDNFFD